MNSLILFLSHSIWILLAIGTIGYGLRDVVEALHSHFAGQDHTPAQPTLALRADYRHRPLGRNVIFSH